MKLFISFFLILFIIACNTQRRDIKKFDSYAIQYPAEMARLANLLDPCFTTKPHSDTVTKLHSDTITTPGSIVITRVKDTIVKTVTLQGKQITAQRIITIHDTLTDNRALTAFGSLFRVKADSLIIKNTQLNSVTHGKNTWMWIAIGCIVVILAFVIWNVYKLFNPVARVL